MAKNRYVNTHIWRDGYFTSLDPSEKLLFSYCLTAPDSNICGIYEVPLKIIAMDTGLEPETVQRIFQRFEKAGKIMYKDGWIALKNFTKHQLDNPKVRRGIDIGLAQAPAFLRKWIVYRYSIDSLSHSNLNPNPNPNPNPKDVSNEKPNGCDVFKVQGKKRGHLPEYCRTRTDRNWCINDKTECLKLFNGISKDLRGAGLDPSSDKWHGAFKNRLHQLLNQGAEEISAQAKAANQ